jgi:hypothetical protein
MRERHSHRRLDNVGFFYTRKKTVGTISAVLLSGYSGPLVRIEEALLPFASLLQFALSMA